MKSLIILGLMTVLTLLSGCTALRFGYNQAPELAYWWIDAYVDFDDAQTVRAREELAAWFRWHRATQLPEHARQLARAQAQVLEPTTPAAVCRWSDEVLARGQPAFDRALPVMAEIALTLKPAQLKHIAKRFDKVNDTFKSDYLQEDAQERLDAAVERIEDRAKTLYGKLTDTQLERLRQRLAVSPFDPVVWLAERRQRQADTLQMLRRLSAERATPDQAQTAIRVLYDHMGRSPREPYRVYANKLQQYNCMVAAELHNSTNTGQRQGAAKKLKGWEEDLRALTAAGTPG